LAAGSIAAIIMAFGTGAVAEFAVAIVSGVLAAFLVSRATMGPRHATVAPTNVVPNA